MGMVERRSTDGIMQCKDGYVMLLTPEEHQWDALVKLMGNPEWAHSEWCRDREKRAEHRDDIKQSIAAWMKARGRFGGQNKVPRVINDSELFRGLAQFALNQISAARN